MRTQVRKKNLTRSRPGANFGYQLKLHQSRIHQKKFGNEPLHVISFATIFSIQLLNISALA